MIRKNKIINGKISFNTNLNDFVIFLKYEKRARSKNNHIHIDRIMNFKQQKNKELPIEKKNDYTNKLKFMILKAQMYKIIYKKKKKEQKTNINGKKIVQLNEVTVPRIMYSLQMLISSTNCRFEVVVSCNME